MYDVIKVFGVFIGFIGISALCEWIADNAPWVNWILTPIAIWIAFIAIFGNHFEEYGKEEK